MKFKFQSKCFLEKFFNIFSLSLSFLCPVLPGELFHQHFSFAALGCFCLCVCVCVAYLAQNSRYFLSLLPGSYPTLGCITVQQGAGLVEGIGGTGATAAVAATL